MCSSPQFGAAWDGTAGWQARGTMNHARLLRAKSGEGRGDAALFKRCLRLLGVQLDEQSGNSGGISPVSMNTSRKNVRGAPTLCTRVVKRTVSLSEICSNTGQPKEQVERDVIAKAVYEEWYFRKLRNAHQQKIQRDTEDAEKQAKLLKEAARKQQKAQENFDKWKNSKIKIQDVSKQQTILKNNPRDRRFGASRASDTKDKAAEAFHLWKKEKDKMLLRKKKDAEDMCKKEEEKKKLEKERKAAAEAALQAWRKRADEALKLQSQKENEMRKKLETKKKRQLKEKQENSGSSFKSWNNMKTAQMKKKAVEERLAAEREQTLKAAQQQERLNECDLAFEEWLRRVEAREDCGDHRSSRRVTVPWIPC